MTGNIAMYPSEDNNQLNNNTVQGVPEVSHNRDFNTDTLYNQFIDQNHTWKSIYYSHFMILI